MRQIIHKLENWKNTYLIFNKRNVACALTLITITLAMYIHVAQNMIRAYVRMEAYSFLRIALILSILQGVQLKIEDIWRKTYGVVLLISAPALTFYCMEYMNDNKISEMSFIFVALNYLIYFMVYLILYIISNRLSFSIIAGQLLFFAYIVINNFVYQYRGNPIRAFDVLAIGTALSITEGYEFKLNYRATLIMVYMFVYILLALKIRWHENNIRKRLVTGVCLIVLAVNFVTVYLTKEYIDDNELSPNNWEVEKSVSEHGMLWDLVAGIPYLKIEEPKGYSSAEAAAIEKEGAASIADNNETSEVKPDVIVVMNESFSDLRVLGDIQTNVEYLGFTNSLEDNTVRGNAYVPIRGGLTSNSEFEFMTGYTCAFLPENSIAYQTVIRNDTYNLGGSLKAEGYQTTFLHPYYAKGWNRNGVYKDFGFDNTIFLEDMEFDNDTDFVRNYVSDSANYRELIKEYEKQKERDNPVFLFNVTMQNHGGYNWMMDDVEILYPQGNITEAQEYLSLIKKSDEAFQDLIEYFATVETPTVVLMFGDHQPTLMGFTQELQEGTTEDDIAGKMEEYCVPFIIWANYDIEEKVYDGISMNYLQIILSETANQPLNQYQKYLKNLMNQFPVITSRGVKDATGNWYLFEEAKLFEEINDYRKVQYWALNSKKK